jgi:hypothetical protein
MTQFLTGDALSRRIRDVASGANARLAVAFWGRGAPSELFGPGVAGRDDLRIICDIGMGGTNPEALADLGAPGRDGIRHCENLHAKVYLSDAGVVVGSANASSNGIGNLADPSRLTEAGTFSDAHSPAWDAAAAWFEDLWTRATVVDADAMDRSSRTFVDRARASGEQVEFRAGPAARSFLDYNPDVHELVLVSWYTDVPGAGEFPNVADMAFRNGVQLRHHLARGDVDVMNMWMVDVHLDEDDRAAGELAPRLFYLNAQRDEPARSGEYPVIYYQRRDATLPQAPFELDATLCAAVLEVVNRDEFGALRDVDGAEPWRIADHINLMRDFWRAVREAYPGA